MAKEKTPKRDDYQEWRDQFLADPERRAIYEEEAAKSDLWLQLVEARQAAGLTQQQVAERMGVSQAQVARIEKRGYDSHTLNTLRRYVAALGAGFSLEVQVHLPEREEAPVSQHIDIPYSEVFSNFQKKREGQ